MRQLPHCSLRQKENVYQPSDTNQQLIKEMLNYSIPQVRDHVRNKASEEFTFEPPRGQTQRISSHRSFYNEEDNRASSEKPDHQCSKRNSSKANSQIHTNSVSLRASMADKSPQWQILPEHQSHKLDARDKDLKIISASQSTHRKN